MNIQTDTAAVNPMQATEAFPLEDRSLPANVVLNEQQAEVADGKEYILVFIP